MGQLKYPVPKLIASWVIFATLFFCLFSANDLVALFRLEALLPAAQLFLASLFLSFIGWSVANTFRIKISNCIWALLSGQVIALLWVYLRSGLNLLTGKHYLPITLLEFATLVIVLGFVSRKELLAPWRARKSLSLQLLSIFIACFLVATRELPRSSMMSSDPDLHVFWAAQIQRLGTIPLSLQDWGPEGLRYPAGFAALNFIWSTFSLLDLHQIVAVQSIFQTHLALLLLLAGCLSFVRFKRERAGLNFALSVFVLSLYYFLLPYGHQVNFFHLEGTARTSCLFMLAGMSLAVAAVFTERHKLGFVALASALSVIVISINPIHALYAGPALLISVLAGLFLTRDWRPLVGLLLPLILFCDPYFTSQKDPSSSIALDQVSLFGSLSKGATTSLLAPIGSTVSAFNNYFTIDFYPANLIHKIIVALLAFYIIFRFRFKKRFLKETFLLLLPVIILVLLSFVIIPGLSPLTSLAQYRLLFPYALHLSQQFIYLWIAFLLILTITLLSRRVYGYLLVIICLPVLFLFGHLRTEFAQLRFEPRYKIDSGLGFPTEDDLAVIKQIESFSIDVKSRYPEIGFEKSPKILIANFMSDTGWEQWLFPYGGSRALPLRNVLPLAFYYSQGSKDFSYQNYKDKICKSFDSQWLKERNIRYLFLPSQRGPICIRSIDKLLEPEMILFRQGNSIFSKIF